MKDADILPSFPSYNHLLPLHYQIPNQHFLITHTHTNLAFLNPPTHHITTSHQSPSLHNPNTLFPLHRPHVPPPKQHTPQYNIPLPPLHNKIKVTKNFKLTRTTLQASKPENQHFFTYTFRSLSFSDPLADSPVIYCSFFYMSCFAFKTARKSLCCVSLQDISPLCFCGVRSVIVGFYSHGWCDTLQDKSPPCTVLKITLQSVTWDTWQNELSIKRYRVNLHGTLFGIHAVSVTAFLHVVIDLGIVWWNLSDFERRLVAGSPMRW